VATCPCALSLATPTALAAATGRLAGRGLLIARPDALETLARVTHVVLDKTGTLTQGRLQLVETRITGERSESDCLAMAASLERHSEHPLAAMFSDRDTPGKASDIEVERGSGVEGTIDGTRLRIGRPDWVAALSGTQALNPEEADEAWIALGDEHDILALFRVDDPARNDAKATVDALRAQGLEVEIASGDAPEPVRRLAREVGITEWRARCLPEDKLARVRELQSRGAVVLMAGDGINDAPVLAGADIAVAVGRGTALAQISAGIIALGDRLNGVVEALTTGRRTLRIIRQNLGLSLAYNATMLPLAAVGLVAPWAAAIGMTLSSVGVVLNARRLA
jgi:Cu2+-exporting ATPase